MRALAKRDQIGPNSVLQRASEMLFNKIDEEVVMLSITNSEYYGLDKVGSRIWELLESPVSMKELVRMLLEEYDVSQEQCEIDTVTFLNKLIDKKLLNSR